MDNLEELKRNFDLVTYVEYITGGRLKKVGNTFYIVPCPICGKDKTHFSIREVGGVQLYKCFCPHADVKEAGSIIDFIMEYDKINESEAIAKFKELAGGHKVDYKKNNKDSKLNTEQGKDYKKIMQDLKRFQEEIKEQESFNKVVAYMTSRSFTEAQSKAFIDKYKLGYNKALNSLIIPLRQGYIYRSLNTKSKGLQGDSSLINLETLQDNFIFICEGFFDMLSLEALSLKAISLNSVNQVKNFMELLSSRKDFQEKKYIIALDNDEAGSSATENLKSYFKSNNISYSILELSKAEGEEKQDINNLFCTNKDLLQKSIEKAKSNFFASTLFNQKSMLKLSEANTNKSSIKTNYDKLDNMLSGGLQEAELTILGAESSVGKTTFMLNLMDNISIDRPVLYFSIEQSTHELYCKLLSKEYYCTNKATKNYMLKDRINKKIGSMRDFQNMNNITISEYEKMQELRASRDKNIFFIEGNFNINVDTIKKQIEDFISLFGKVPLVIIDYLQIIKAPIDSRMNDKQVLDYNITTLRQISRSTKAHIICISSLNRASYSKKIGLQALKESGALEYTADNVFILYPLEVIEGEEEGAEAYKSKSTKIAGLKLLKYRAGLIKKEPLLFDFIGNYSYFIEKDFYIAGDIASVEVASTKEIKLLFD